jgi:hypothetical protein
MSNVCNTNTSSECSEVYPYATGMHASTNWLDEDLVKYPRLRDIDTKVYTAVLNPGDVLYIPPSNF